MEGMSIEVLIMASVSSVGRGELAEMTLLILLEENLVWIHSFEYCYLFI